MEMNLLNTSFQNYQKIKEAITKRLGLSNIYMYNKLVRNSGNDNIIEYLNKYV